nr:hypothetical protein B0A51_15059 [Rachicladosporium sp. CCFEE 5018]
MLEHDVEAVPLGAFKAGPRAEDVESPSVAPWRNNLTALSQEHNLYFVAYYELIYVYEPSGSGGNTLHTPVHSLRSEPTRPGNRGYLDRYRPHAINNLLIAKLGTEEVLACVRDDGDCDVFLLRHVIAAIETSRQGYFDSFERPMFQISVGISAWGLSIHSAARMLAISSNRHEITVIKFALADQVYDAATSYEAQPAKQDTGESRYETSVQVYHGLSNIPHIAFCNTGDDPHGRWLASTDISGDCRFLDLQAGAIVQFVRFGRSFAEAGYGSYDRINAGWGIIFLDRRSFVGSSKRRALGQDHTEELPDAKTDPTIWDLSRTIRHLGNISDHFLSTPSDPLSSESDDTVSESNISLPDTNMVSTDGDTSNTGSGPTSVLRGANNDMYDDIEDEQTEDAINPAILYGGDRICGNKPRFQQATGICDDLPCPILHASLRNIYLLQPSRFHEIGRHGIFAPPVVGFARPLRQYIQGQHRDLNMFDRMNMHAYIPSLGVVIVASQKGRAIVLALTKVKVGTQTVYAMRAECILPFASQERTQNGSKTALRPFQPLHGIAVGPIPGSEGLRYEDKRWRLFMMYQDYTVLKYEIRRKGGQDAGVANVVI